MTTVHVYNRLHGRCCLTKVIGFHCNWKQLVVWSLLNLLCCWLAKLGIHWQLRWPITKIHTWSGYYSQPFRSQRNQAILHSNSTHRNTAAYSLGGLGHFPWEDHFLTGTFGQDGGRINKFCNRCANKYNRKSYWWTVSKRDPVVDDVGLFSICLKTKRFLDMQCAKIRAHQLEPIGIFSSGAYWW